MSWSFVGPGDIEGQARRERILARVAEWWQAFAGRASEIEREADRSPATQGQPMWVAALSPALAGWLTEQIRSIDPRLGWDLCVDADGTRRLAITPGPALWLRPMTRSIVSRAPPTPGWTFHAHRPALEPIAAAEAVKLRTGHGLVAPTFLPRIGPAHRIDLNCKLRLARTDPASADAVARALAEALLGEQICDAWLGDVEAEALDRGPAAESYLGATQVRRTVHSLIQTVLSHLPDQPLHRQPPARRWHNLKFPVAPAPDYPRQDDATTGRALLKELRAAALGEGYALPPRHPFYSGAFSRCGEIFCYLKIDAESLTIEQRRRRKYELEDSLDLLLRDAKVGSLIGSETGLRYIYLDLAATNLRGALATMAPALASANVPARSWLLFYDTELGEEWVGLHPDAPPPPASLPGARLARSRPPPALPRDRPSDTELFPDDLLL